MHQHGSIVRWDAARGFGFIRCANTQADVFFHVRDFRGAPEPAVRMEVEYEEIHVGGKGPRAMVVRPRQTRHPASGSLHSSSTPHGNRHHGGGNSHAPRNAGRNAPPATGHSAAPSRPAHKRPPARPAPAPAPAKGKALLVVLVIGWLALLGWGLWSGRLPLWTAGALLALNLLTVWAYAADKNAARAGAWRVSENQLHLMALLGGWPAAWLAQQNLRHKTSKAPFRAVYWLTVLGHCAALALWLWRGPAILSF